MKQYPELVAYPDSQDTSIINIRKLAQAILEIAINDLCGLYTAGNGEEYKNKELWKQKYRQRALDWVNSGDPFDQFGSFRWCCDLCELSPEAVTERIRAGTITRIQRRPGKPLNECSAKSLRARAWRLLKAEENGKR